jgi:hypothetical protein
MELLLELLEVLLRCFEQRPHQQWFRRSCSQSSQQELLRNHMLGLELRNRMLVLVLERRKTIGEHGA